MSKNDHLNHQQINDQSLDKSQMLNHMLSKDKEPDNTTTSVLVEEVTIEHIEDFELYCLT